MATWTSRRTPPTFPPRTTCSRPSTLPWPEHTISAREIMLQDRFWGTCEEEGRKRHDRRGLDLRAHRSCTENQRISAASSPATGTDRPDTSAT